MNSPDNLQSEPRQADAPRFWRLTAPLRAIAAVLGLSKSSAQGSAGTAASQKMQALSGPAKRERTAVDTAVRTFGDFAKLEPELLVSIPAGSVGKLKAVAGFPKGPELDGWRKLFHSLEHEYQRLIFIPSADFHGSAFARNAVRAAQERYGPASILVVETDAASPAAGAFPTGAHIRSLSQINPQLNDGERGEIVIMLIHHLQPAAVLNVDSAALWNAIADRGAALSTVTKFYAALDPGDRGLELTERYFRACAPHLTKAYVEDANFIDALMRNHDLPAELRAKLAVLHQPAEAASAGDWQDYLQAFLEPPSFLA